MTGADASTPLAPGNVDAEIPVLAVTNLTTELRLRAGTVTPVRDVSFTLRRGETLGVVGESGSGKTMLGLSIMGLLPPRVARVASGRIELNGTDLVGLRERDRNRLRGDRIAMVFQEPMTSLDPLFTIGYQLTEAISAHTDATREVARRRAVEMLELVRIPSAADRLRSYPHELSGGTRQRVVIAMMLALAPDLLIADEPTTALDVTVQAEILELIADLQSRLHMAMILISHNLAVVSECADRVAVMYAGELVEMASADALFAGPRHPYTFGLLESLPSTTERRDRLYVIPGRPPELVREPTSCPFAPRCPHRIDRCTTDHPQLSAIGPGHHLRCWNPVGST